MVVVGNRKLLLSDFDQVLFKKSQIEPDKHAIEKVSSCFVFLQRFSEGKVIYGINTGFGPMAQYKIDEKDLNELQLNLIRSHSAGSGPLLPELYIKAIMLARLNTLTLGYSGVHEEIIHLLIKLINQNISPRIFERGGVGASGDLVQLAHLALCLIGEGEVNFEGATFSTKELFKKQGILPLEIKMREGLAIMNGTSAMTGIGIINLIYAKKLLQWSILASAMINELVEAYDDYFSDELNKAKLHEGQRLVAGAMRKLLNKSKHIRKREIHLYDEPVHVEVFTDKIQEYYSLRCVPQILGPVLDTLLNAEEVLTDEVNSVSDNPVIDEKNNNVYHGGNFHGDYVALEMDKLKIAVTKLSMLAERQLNYLMNDKLNGRFPPFMNLGTLGLNFGLQGVQFTATSTVAENQTLSFPMYIHSIPNNNDNQDIVSMGTNAALITRKVIDNSFDVIAIEFLTIVQAIDYLSISADLVGIQKDMYDRIRKIVPVFTADSPKYNDIQRLRDLFMNDSINIL